MSDEAEVPLLSTALKPRHVAMIALGGIVGAGLFVGSSTAIRAAGPAVVLSYAFAGAIAFFIMRMLGEMALVRPGLGSFNAYIRAALGTRAGFVAGWLYWYFWIIAVGAETIAGASLLHDWIALPVWLLGVVLIALLTATNLLSVRAYGEFEFWFSLLKVLAIVGFIALAAGFLGLRSWQGQSPADTLLGHGGLVPNGPAAVLGAVPIVIFSLVGSEISSIAAAESADPSGNVARAARTVALRIATFYILAISLIVCVVPWSSIEGGHSPFVDAMDAIGIPGAAVIMRAIIIVAVLSCLNSGLYVTSRILFELADAGHAPRALVAVGPNKVPARSILIGGATGLAAAFASIASPDVVFAFLLNTSGSVILFVYLLIALAQIRSRNERSPADQPPLKMWLFPWLSYGVVAAICLVFLAMAALPDQRIQIFAGLFSVLLVLAGSFVGNRKKAVSPSMNMNIK